MNAPTKVSLPFSLLTATSTVPGVCAGVTTSSVVVLMKVTDAARPSNVAELLAVKPVPVKVTVSPPRGVPAGGESEVKAGGLLYVNPPTRVSLPFSVLTATSTAPGACAAVTTSRVVELTKVTDAARPSNVAELLAVKSVPERVTVSPPSGVPLVGDSEVSEGGSL